MNVVLASFLRQVDEEVLFCNPRTEGAIACKVSSEILTALSGEDIHSIVERISIICNTNYSEIENDIICFYNELSDQGLVRIKNDKWCKVPKRPVDADKIVDLKINRAIGKCPVEEFYERHGCLASVHIDLTDACTERCVHCYVPQGQCDFLPYDLVEKVLREFREQQGLTVQLSGGECMMHPDFLRICRLCRKLDLNFIVLSNLTRCDKEVIEVLKETDPQFVNVSLYSLAPEEHDAITQIRGSWKKTMAAIDACQQAGIHIRLATPLLKANQHAYPALRKFAKERHVHLIPDCEIIPKCNGDCSNLNYVCSPEEVEDVLLQDKAFWDRGYGRRVIPSPKDKVCDIGKLLCLNSKGEYYPCSGMHGYVLGNARNDTLTEVWRGEKMEYLRGLKNKDFPKCAGCEHRPFCKVCPAFNYNATGSLFETIPAKCALAEVKHRVFGEK